MKTVNISFKKFYDLDLLKTWLSDDLESQKIRKAGMYEKAKVSLENEEIKPYDHELIDFIRKYAYYVAGLKECCACGQYVNEAYIINNHCVECLVENAV